MNSIYPVGSQHRSKDLWQELPREDCGMVQKDGSAILGFIIGGFISVCLWVAIYEVWALFLKGLF